MPAWRVALDKNSQTDELKVITDLFPRKSSAGQIFDQSKSSAVWNDEPSPRQALR